MIFKISSEKIEEFIEKQHAIDCMVSMHDFELWLEEQPRVGEWIPITFRETTDDDGIDKEEHPIMLECPLPDHGQEVFISTKSGYVMEDTFYDDDGAYLEDNDWDEVAAWMPLPEPYKEGK